MSREIEKVTKIENGQMEVKVPTGNGCAFCQGKTACTFSGPDSAYRHFNLPAQSGIREGDQVTLEIRESAQNLSALVIFGSPVILFPVSYLLLNNLFKISNIEIWLVVATAVLYGITLLLSNHFLSRLAIFRPRIAEVEKSVNPGKGAGIRGHATGTLKNSNYLPDQNLTGVKS